MDVMNMPNKTSSFLDKLKMSYKLLGFVPAENFYWSPVDKTIHYRLATVESDSGQWALLHEVAHSDLGHLSYGSDIELLQFEVAAWHKALDLAKSYNVDISEDHVEECLNTYRDWLHFRSTCPKCYLNGLQTLPTTYVCLNCQASWQVSSSRFCRPYRMQSRQQKTPLGEAKAVFMQEIS